MAFGDSAFSADPALGSADDYQTNTPRSVADALLNQVAGSDLDLGGNVNPDFVQQRLLRKIQGGFGPVIDEQQKLYRDRMQRPRQKPGDQPPGPPRRDSGDSIDFSEFSKPGAPVPEPPAPQAQPQQPPAQTPPAQQEVPDETVTDQGRELSQEEMRSLPRRMAGGVGRSLMESGATALKGAGDYLNSEYLRGLGEKLEKGAPTEFPMTRAEKASLGYRVGSDIGGLVPFVAPAIAGAPAAAAGLVGSTALGWGTWGGGIALAGLMGGEEQAKAARETGASPEAIHDAAQWGAITNAGLMAVPLGAFLKPVERDPGLKAWVLAKLKQAGREGITFAGYNEANAYVASKIAQEFYKPDAEYNFDVQRALDGFLAGAIIGPLHGTHLKPDEEAAIRKKAVADIPEAEDLLRKLAENNTPPNEIAELLKRLAGQNKPGAEPPTAGATPPGGPSPPTGGGPFPLAGTPYEEFGTSDNLEAEVAKWRAAGDHDLADEAEDFLKKNRPPPGKLPPPPAPPPATPPGERPPTEPPAPNSGQSVPPEAAVGQPPGPPGPTDHPSPGQPPGTSTTPINIEQGAADLQQGHGTINEAPSPEQAEAGNYQHIHADLPELGLTGKNGLAIETKAGGIRFGPREELHPKAREILEGSLPVLEQMRRARINARQPTEDIDAQIAQINDHLDNGAPAWQARMDADYGRAKGIMGADGQGLDFFVGPGGQGAWVLDQMDPKTGKFDEHKVFAKVANQQVAQDIYTRSFDNPQNAQKRIGGWTYLTPEQFKQWTKSGKVTKPLSQSAVAADVAARGKKPPTEKPPAEKPPAPPAGGGDQDVQNLADFFGGSEGKPPPTGGPRTPPEPKPGGGYAPPIGPDQQEERPPSPGQQVLNKATGNPIRFNNSHTVRSLANSNLHDPDEVYIDHRFPRFDPKVTDKTGKPADLWKYIGLHETDEAHALKGAVAEFHQKHGRAPNKNELGTIYDTVHSNVATPAEMAALKADGVDEKKYNAAIDGFLNKIEHEPNTNPPPTPHIDPDLAIGHHRSTNKAVAKEVEQEIKGGGEIDFGKAFDDIMGTGEEPPQTRHEAYTAIEEAAQAAGVKLRELMPVDIARAAEIMRDHGLSENDALAAAVLSAELRDGNITKEQIREIFGPEALEAVVRAAGTEAGGVRAPTPGAGTGGEAAAPEAGERAPGGGAHGGTQGGEAGEAAAPAEGPAGEATEGAGGGTERHPPSAEGPREPAAEPAGEPTERPVREPRGPVSGPRPEPVGEKPAEPEPAGGEVRGPAEVSGGVEDRRVISTGVRLRTVSGRITSPAPKIEATSDRKTKNTLNRMYGWLLDEAKIEAKDNEHVSLLLKGIDPKRLSQSDQDLINEVLFGNPDGATQANVVKEAGEKPPSAADIEKRFSDALAEHKIPAEHVLPADKQLAFEFMRAGADPLEALERAMLHNELEAGTIRADDPAIKDIVEAYHAAYTEHAPKVGETHPAEPRGHGEERPPAGGEEGGAAHGPGEGGEREPTGGATGGPREPAGGAGAEPRPEPGAAGERGAVTLASMLPAYDKLKAEQGGFSTVWIGDLIKETGWSKEDMHRMLLDEAKAGNVTIHHSTLQYTSIPEERMDAAIRLPGEEEPFFTVVVKKRPEAGEQEEPKNKFVDTGHIGGARKDRWKGGLRQKDIDEMTPAEQARHVTKENIFPRPDYAGLVEDGVEPIAAALMKRIYDRLPGKPNTRYQKGEEAQRQYITVLQAIRDAMSGVRTPADLRAAQKQVSQAIVGRTDRWSTEQFGTVMADKGRRRFDHPAAYNHDDIEAANKMVAQGFPNTEPWQRRFEIRKDSVFRNGKFTGEEEWAVLRRNPKEDESYFVGGPDKRFKTEAEAIAAAKAEYDKIGKGEGEKLPTEHPHLDEIAREGPDYRGGKDVTDSKQVQNAFGYKEVEWGEWASQEERQKVANLAYDALHDLARALNIDPKAVSLNGSNSIAFGSRGRGGRASAHYEPDRLVINMTKLKGAGSLGHEWWHALDHYLGEVYSNAPYQGAPIEASGGGDRSAVAQVRKNARAHMPGRLGRALNDLYDAIHYNVGDKTERLRQEDEIRKRAALDYWQKSIDGARARLRDPTADHKKARKRIEKSEKALANNTRWMEQEFRKIAQANPRTESEYFKEAQKLSGASGKDGYWARPNELHARAFESWLFDRLGQEGHKSQYLVQGVEPDRYASGFKGNPYPAGQDRIRINKAFDVLFDAITATAGKNGEDTSLIGKLNQAWVRDGKTFEMAPGTQHLGESQVRGKMKSENYRGVPIRRGPASVGVTEMRLPMLTPEQKVRILEDEMKDLDKSQKDAAENPAAKNPQVLAGKVAAHFADGGSFNTIVEARKFAKDNGFVLDDKQVDEAVELGVVKHARSLVDDAKARGLSHAETFDALKNLYDRQPRLGVRTSSSMREQAYSTPVPLAYIASRLARVTPEKTVLEPTAGNGALLIEANPRRSIVNEINPERAKNLEDQGFQVLQEDASHKFRLIPEKGGDVIRPDVVLANPPFGSVRQEGVSKVFDMSDIQPGYRTHEIDHAIALRALEGMKDDGRAVLLLGGLPKTAVSQEARSEGYAGKAKREFYKALYDRYNVTDHFTVNGDLYSRQGAAWPIDVIVINGRGKSPRELPAIDVPRIYDSWDGLRGLLDEARPGETGIREGAGEPPAAGDEGRPGARDVEGPLGPGVGGLPRRGPEPGEPGGLRPGSVREEPGVGRAPAGDDVSGAERGGMREPGRSDLNDPARALTAEDFASAFDAFMGEEDAEPPPPPSYPVPKEALVSKPEPEAVPGAAKGKVEYESPRGRFFEDVDGRRSFFEDYEPAPTAPESAKTAPTKGKTAKVDTRGTGEVAKATAKAGVESAEAAMEGLYQLFTGGKTTLTEGGLVFNEENYQKSKPLFIKAAEKYVEFKDNLIALMGKLLHDMEHVYHLSKNNLRAMRPFVVKFMEDVRDGVVKLFPDRPKQTKDQVPYDKRSGGKSLGTVIPINLKRPTDEALKALEDKVGNLDDYVAKHLDYKSNDEMWEGLGGEQVDALGMIFSGLTREPDVTATILGDMTGVGKGRVMASVARWGLKNGKIPIFITARPDLFVEMYDDMTQTGLQKHLGREPRILATGSSMNLPLDPLNPKKLVLKSGSAQEHGLHLAEMSNPDALREKYDMVFTTYAQMQTVRGGETARRRFLRAIAPHAILLMDEAHKAGGQGATRQNHAAPMGRAGFARDLISRARRYVTYASATWAKHPNVMDLYFATDLSMAVPNPSDLGEAVARGGVPLQQVMSAMLAESGQYPRREISYDGVVYDPKMVPVDREQYDAGSRGLMSVHQFSGFVARVVKQVRRQMLQQGGVASLSGATGIEGADSSNFTSTMHNLVGQSLLAMKARPAVDKAIEALRNGQKPVLTVANTMESFIVDHAENEGIAVGKPMTADFKDVFHRYLERTRTIRIKRAHSNESEKYYLSDEDLRSVPGALEAYDRAKRYIDNLDLPDLPLSPIDYIKSELEKAGYKVGEITGRSAMINYSGDEPTLGVRPGAELTPRGKKKTQTDFNNGGLDAIIINQSAAEGISLHSSVRFKDQRQRHMIIVQPEANIDTHMQILGRIKRTGEVHRPYYTHLVADIPSEKRPTAILMKKMASLNANTTAARDSPVTARDVPDLMNEYGDEVAINWAHENPDINQLLERPVKFGQNGEVENDDPIRVLTGRLALLPLADQEAHWDYLEREYKELLANKEAAGENALEAKVLPLKARTTEISEVVPRKNDSGSVFAAPVNIEKATVARLGKPYSPTEIAEKIAKQAGIDKTFGKDPEEALRWLEEADKPYSETARALSSADDERANDATERFREYRRATLDELPDDKAVDKERTRLNKIEADWNGIHTAVTPGARISLLMPNGNQIAVAIGVKQEGHPKNPLALSSWKATFAIADSGRQVIYPFSKLAVRDDQLTPTSIFIRRRGDEEVRDTYRWFTALQREVPEERYIATGNLLAAFDWLGHRGNITHFTDREGNIRQGILTARDWDLAGHARERGTEFNAQQAVEYLNANPDTALASTHDNTHVLALPTLAVSKNPNSDTYFITTAQDRTRGGQFFLDERLTDLVGNFQSRNNRMVVRVGQNRIHQAISRLQELGARFMGPAGEITTRRVGEPETPPEPPEGGGATAAGSTAKAGSTVLGRGELTPMAEGKRKEIENALGAIVQQMVGDNVRVEFPGSIALVGAGYPEGADRSTMITSGQYLPGKALIHLAMDTILGRLALHPPETRALDLAKTAWHEAYHAAEDHFMNRNEYGVMEREMPRLRDYAAGQGGWDRADMEKMAPWEVRARAFERYASERAQGKAGLGLHIVVRRVFDRILETLRRIKSFLHGQGFQTSEDIFKKAYEGEWAKRESQVRPGEQTLLEMEMQGERPFPTWRDAFRDGGETEEPAAAQSITKQTPEERAAWYLRQTKGDAAHAIHLVDSAKPIMDRLHPDYFERTKDALIEQAKAQYPQAIERMRAMENRQIELGGDIYGGVPRGLVNWERFKADKAAEIAARPEAAKHFQAVRDQQGQRMAEARVKQRRAGLRVVGEEPRHSPETDAILSRIRNAIENGKSFWNDENGALTLPSLRAVHGRISAALGGDTATGLIEKVQNYNVRLKQMQEAVQARRFGLGLGTLPEQLQSYALKVLYPGKVRDRHREFDEQHFNPMRDFMRRNGIGIEQAGQYLGARHAEERNEEIGKLYPPAHDFARARKDHDVVGGSGMSTNEAKAIIANYEHGPKAAAYAELRRRVDDVRDWIQREMVDNGLESQKTIDKWNNTYGEYVPLRGWEDPAEMPEHFQHEGGGPQRRGSGSVVAGPEVKRAFGRKTHADNPLASMLDLAYRTADRAEKNRVLVSTARMLQSLPMRVRQDIGRINMGHGKPEIDRSTGFVRWVPDPSDRYDRNAVPYKVNGRTHFIYFEDARLADAGKRWSPITFQHGSWTEPKNWLGNIFRIQQHWKTIVTMYSPNFQVRHNLRYFQESVLNAFEFKDTGDFHLGKFIKEAAPVVGDAFRAINAVEYGRTIGKPSKELMDYYREMREQGGVMEMMSMRDLDQITETMRLKIKSLSDPKTTVQAYLRNVREFALGAQKLTAAMDNSQRLAAYAAARRQGMTPQKAALKAREATVDYQMKGLYANVLGLWEPFFNTALQQGVRTTTRYFTSPSIRKVAAGMMLFSLGLSAWNYLVGGNDDDGVPFIDKIAPWDLSKNMVFLMPWAKDSEGRPQPLKLPAMFNWAVPMSLGYAAGNLLWGSWGPSKVFKNLVADPILSSFSQVGDEPMGFTQRTLWPNIGRELAYDLPANTDWQGRQIHSTEDRQKGPASWSGRRGETVEGEPRTGAFWNWAAQTINAATGGGQQKSGYVDPYPESLRTLADPWIGTHLRLLQQIGGTAGSLISGEAPKPKQVPLASVVFGSDYDAADRAASWQRRDRARHPWKYGSGEQYRGPLYQGPPTP